MGRLLLVGRLAVRDLRRRRTETVLLLLAVLAATTTLTLGLVLRDAATDPYERTRLATNGPDVVATGRQPDDLARLAGEPGVTDHSGPFPAAAVTLTASGRTSDAQAVGRDADAATVDRPRVTDGAWVRDGGVVLEAAFAAALDVRVGSTVTLNGRSFTVVGVAVTAAMPPYPKSSCVFPCMNGDPGAGVPAGLLRNPGLVWLTRPDALGLAGDRPAYVLNLKLADPSAAPAFAASHGFVAQPWQTIRDDATELARDSQILLLLGAWLLGLLAVASLSVLVGGRMADRTRRVGLLKAVGGTPGLVAAVLLTGYVLVALVAAAGGLVLGALTAPLLTGPTAGLVGTAGTPALTPSTVGAVTAVAVAVAALAAAVPALRAARSSTVAALADAARPPRRVGWLIAVSRRLPVPLLLALRLAARRPRRVVLAVLSIAVTVSGIVVVLALNAFLDTTGTYGAEQVAALRRVLAAWMAVLLGLAAVNKVVITWATVLDNRHSSALARALGATPHDVTTALAAAQILPALAGALLGVFPGGVALYGAVNAVTGGDSGRAPLPPLWHLLLVVVATVLTVTALTAVPARLGSRYPVTRTL